MDTKIPGWQWTIAGIALIASPTLRAGGDELLVKTSTILPPGITSYTVPDPFIALIDVWKYEVLVRESSFNQTAVESCFIISE